MYSYCMDPCLLTYRLDENIYVFIFILHGPPLCFLHNMLANSYIMCFYMYVCIKKQHVLSELSGLSVMKKEISVSTLQLFETI